MRTLTTREIRLIDDQHARLDAFIDRWLELEEKTGCRTLQERDEMAEIADAIMTKLIQDRAYYRQKLRERKLVERAKGVLMKRMRWTESTAFARLQRYAMNQRRPMIEVAQDVINGVELEI